MRTPTPTQRLQRRAAALRSGALRLGALWVCLWGVLCPGHSHAEGESAAPGRLTLGAGLHYSIGHYGAPETTEVLYVPLAVRYDNDLGAVSLTVPYIAIRGQGEPVPGGVVFDATSDKRVSSEGLGDVLAAASYTAYRGAEPLPWLDVTAIVKFATADPDRQLGTGENDYALQLDAYQRWNAWNWFATLGYRTPGSPEGYHFRNGLYASGGASHPLAQTVKAGLMWSGQQPLTDGADPAQDVIAFSSWTLSPLYTLHSYLSRGFTRASAEWAVGITLMRSS